VALPLSIRRFFAGRGVAVLASELVWVWLPSILFATSMVAIRRLAAERERVT